MREGMIFSNQDMSVGDPYSKVRPIITDCGSDPAPGRPNSAGYRTAVRYRPSGGAVAALTFRSRLANTAATRSGGESPEPTDISRPAMFRTMWCRKAFAVTAIVTHSA